MSREPRQQLLVVDADRLPGFSCSQAEVKAIQILDVLGCRFYMFKCLFSQTHHGPSLSGVAVRSMFERRQYAPVPDTLLVPATQVIDTRLVQGCRIVMLHMTYKLILGKTAKYLNGEWVYGLEPISGGSITQNDLFLFGLKSPGVQAGKVKKGRLF